MDARMLERHVRLEARGQELLRAARRRGLLSARGEHRVLRVARTIADLDGQRARAHVPSRRRRSRCARDGGLAGNSAA